MPIPGTGTFRIPPIVLCVETIGAEGAGRRAERS